MVKLGLVVSRSSRSELCLDWMALMSEDQNIKTTSSPPDNAIVTHFLCQNKQFHFFHFEATAH
jgi:hypothetical protein